MADLTSAGVGGGGGGGHRRHRRDTDTGELQIAGLRLMESRNRTPMSGLSSHDYRGSGDAGQCQGKGGLGGDKSGGSSGGGSHDQGGIGGSKSDSSQQNKGSGGNKK